MEASNLRWDGDADVVPKKIYFKATGSSNITNFLRELVRFEGMSFAVWSLGSAGACLPGRLAASPPALL